MAETQAVDPEVSQAKFDREIGRFRAQVNFYRAQGCFLTEATFPSAFFIFATPKLKPRVIGAAVEIDFSNYDLRPPSLVFVDPFTLQPIARKDLQLRMLRRPPLPGTPPEMIATLIQQNAVPLTDFIQSNGPDDPPFLCMAGIREYHDNPAHSGDSWLLHRGSGEGSLAFILDKIIKYGTGPVDQLQIQLQTVVGPMAVSLQAIPE
ncbi:putative metal-binding protein [Mesorhizobium abyssinicae]|uniref:Metal-binding protein n=1 Tax=Mesorhizobium abyssinicae TaxID=1209958 RepID=A0ABU5AW49_9HYPH|nr:putative metal-binding protein [Mesorhizobium abyssinicae]MDX8541546.1 putative metal-binding protein [Mesorhizobium abyssinicae]